MIIYATPLSANGRKVLAVCRQLGVDAEIRLINVYQGEGRTSEYLAINPSGKIPTLVDGKFTLSESNAILIYLAEAHGGGCRLWSDEAQTRSRITQWLFWESAHWQPLLSAHLAEWVGHCLLPQRIARPRAAPDWRSAPLQPLLKALEAALGSRRFLTGPELTIADFSVAGMTTYFASSGFPLADFPAISRWYSEMDALDSWRATASPLWTTNPRPAP